MNLSIRRLAKSDAGLARVAEELNSKDWYEGVQDFTADSLKKFLSDPDNFYIAAEVEGKVVGGLHGYVLLHPDGRKLVYIDEVDTIKGHRRQGVATAMMQEAFELSKERGASEAWLGTEHDNEPAKALYQKLGPSEIDEGPIYTYKVN
ncbi:MAG TPA: GNAT family N-acetyltransferase [Candidatus Saccharimonadales bacterium]|nr:GNAT family N-acetyltransferase [Candidatus Saccharimonadales bacterium]